MILLIVCLFVFSDFLPIDFGDVIWQCGILGVGSERRDPTVLVHAGLIALRLGLFAKNILTTTNLRIRPATWGGDFCFLLLTKSSNSYSMVFLLKLLFDIKQKQY